MKKIIILVCITAALFSCSKPKQSKDFLYGSKLYNNFVNYYLKGEPRLAEMAFESAEMQFQKMDAMCNLSRIYIGRYVLDEANKETAVLERASRYAELGGCLPETEAIKYLSGEKYDKDILPEPYKSIGKGESETLIELAEKKDTADYTKTRLLRRAAIDYLISDPAKSEELGERALVTDRFNGWTLNILRDLIVIKSAREKQGKEINDIAARIKLIKNTLDKK